MPPVDGPAQPDEPIPPVSLDKPATEPTPPAPVTETAPPADPWAPPSADAGPPPAGPGPYPPLFQYPQPWGQPPAGPPQTYNGLAIAAMATGLLGGFCFLWVLGIVLGIIALRQIKARNEKGRGMAVTGIVAGVVWVIVLGAVMVVALSGPFMDGYNNGRASYRAAHTSVFDLTRGTCFKDGTAIGSTVKSVKTVPCSDPHDGEMYARVSLSLGNGREDFPGAAELTRRTDRACAKELVKYVMDSQALPATVRSSFFYPDRTAWSAGSVHTGVCTLATKDGPHSGSLQQDTSNLTSAQIVYLNASHVLETALFDKPDGTATEHPAEYRSWARQVAAGIDGELEQLGSGTWDGSASKAVSVLVTDLHADLAHWRAAALSTDTAVLASEVHQGLGHLAGNTSEVRSALGLPTITVDDPVGGSGSGDPTQVV
ncbi:DUF4190 domain-containing protein [Kitasatospora sp. NPDC002227]|uniref:DUF4190 domain-containing protein n=1 Tax=Kitasatospora sp. NPDC002227 TaxID=3154773 RepID=UPI00331F1ABB